MKMSDVFGNRNITSRGTIIKDRDIERSSLGAFNTNTMAKAAAHAINQHDALVAMNAELIKMASDISQMCVGEIAMGYRIDAQSIGEYIYSVTGLNSEELVAKAKELSQ